MEQTQVKKAALHNLGCKVNSYETEVMEQQLREAGYQIVPFAPGADVYVINTCSVTNVADRKSRQMLHRAKKMNPGAVIVAAGCYVQTAVERTGLAVEAAYLAMEGTGVSPRDGILDDKFEDLIAHLGQLVCEGMSCTNQTIVRIMKDEKGPA